MINTSFWYLLIGFLLGNGMPHFSFGVAGRIFRTPFGRESSPRSNVGWGLFNFIGATLLAWGRLAAASPEVSDLVYLLVGFWLAVLMFGLFIKRFISERTGL